MELKFLASYLKGTVLASLEAQGLIHKRDNYLPLETQKEFGEAVTQATRQNRRAEQKAIKQGLQVPPPQEPATMKKVYGWRIGPDPKIYPEGVTGSDEARWTRAEKMEEQYYLAKTREARQTAARQLMRREAFKRERERQKLQRAEDDRLGRTEEIRKERKRLVALAKIQEYAKITGEDVSGWYEELGQGDVDEAPDFSRITVSKGGTRAWRDRRFGLR